MKVTYILTRTTQKACPDFEILGSYESLDLVTLEKAKLEENLKENQFVKIQEIPHNDSLDLEVEREGIELYVSDEYDNRHYMEVMCHHEEITEGPIVIGKCLVMSSVNIYDQETKKLKLSRKLKKELDYQGERVIDYINEMT